MNFSKTFLAGLLAFIVGNILIAVLWSLCGSTFRRTSSRRPLPILSPASISVQ